MKVSKVEFEIDFWEKYLTGNGVPEANKPDKQYKRYLEVWGIGDENLGKVLEVGTGPIMGCLPYVNANIKHGLDPLYNDYRKAGLLENTEGIKLFNKPIERHYCSVPTYDTILCGNALDHGDSDFSSIKNISDCLMVGGKFYLHVHLRKQNELNIAHDHTLKLEDFLKACKENKLKVDYKVYDNDPVELGTTYNTLIAICEKSL